jgi:hypothetical protein
MPDQSIGALTRRRLGIDVVGMTAPGTQRARAHAAACPQMAEADIRVLMRERSASIHLLLPLTNLAIVLTASTSMPK